jgi:hypothetical protein
MKWTACLLLAACSVDPLTAAQLYGGPGDAAVAAGAPAPAADAPAALPDARSTAPPDGAPPPPDAAPAASCRMTDLGGSVSGDVFDDCDGQPLEALVGIGGKHTCSFQGKGSFYIPGLPVGCDLWLTSKREGYHEHGETVTIKPNGNPGLRIRLRRQTPCPAPRPAGACQCTGPTCVPS